MPHNSPDQESIASDHDKGGAHGSRLERINQPFIIPAAIEAQGRASMCGFVHMHVCCVEIDGGGSVLTVLLPGQMEGGCMGGGRNVLFRRRY